VYREPLPTWITRSGRICLLGDAAHPFLPTSIQGCSQAIEDGCVLATCLALSHADTNILAQEKVPTGLRTYQLLRYEWVKAAQIEGEKLRNTWHTVDWNKVRRNPESIKLPRADWLLLHDCEENVRTLWPSASVDGAEPKRGSLAAGPGGGAGGWGGGGWAQRLYRSLAKCKL